MSPSSSYSLQALINLRLGELEKKILDIAGELEEFTLKDLCERLKQQGKVSKGSVKHAVSRLVNKGLLERVRRGVFRCAGDRFTKPTEDRFTKHYRSIHQPRRRSIHQIHERSHVDRFTNSTGDRFTKSAEDQFRIQPQSIQDHMADRFRIPSEEARDKTTGEPRGLGRDKSSGEQIAKPIEELKTQIVETKPPASIIITTTKGEEAPAEGNKQPPVEGGQEISPAYGGVGGLRAGIFGFMVHRVVLGFGFGVLPHFVLGVFPGGSCREVRESGQLVCRDVVGRGREVAFEFNVKSNGGLVFLEASESPLGVEEFLGFVDWYLLQVFRRITGREVSRSEFAVKAAPHLNADLPGAYLEGVKSITLQDYYDEVVRKYLKKIDGETYTRVEVEAKSWVDNSLDDVVNGLVTFAKLPIIASKLEKVSAKLEEIAESGISGRAIAAAVKTDLANLIYAFYLKVADVLINQFAPALAPEIGKAVRDAISEFLRNMEAVRREHGKLLTEFKKLNKRVEELTRENAELKRKIEEYELAQRQVKFDDLPAGLREVLKHLESQKLVELQETRIQYGGVVRAQLARYRYNFDAWLESVKYELPRQLQHIGIAVLKAIRFYDNRYGDKPGVPYSIWLRRLEEYLKPLTLDQSLRIALGNQAEKPKSESTSNTKELEDLLRERVKKEK